MRFYACRTCGRSNEAESKPLLASRTVSRAARGLHRPNSRVEDTLNDEFRLVSGTPEKASVILPESPATDW